MDKLIIVVEQAEEGGYNARAETESIFTQADRMEELQANIAEAIGCHFDTPDLPMFALKFVDSDNK